jgi:hypothetical protein
VQEKRVAESVFEMQCNARRAVARGTGVLHLGLPEIHLVEMRNAKEIFEPVAVRDSYVKAHSNTLRVPNRSYFEAFAGVLGNCEVDGGPE